MLERLSWIYVAALLAGFAATGSIDEFCCGLLLGAVLAIKGKSK